MHGSCVHSIRWTSKEVDELTSRQLAGHWSGRTSRASLHAFANEKMQKEANEKTQEHVGTHGSCVHPIWLTSKEVDEWTCRQLAGHWSGRTSRASLQAFANEKTQKEANEKMQEPVGTHGSCVHSIRLTSKQVDELTSWQLTGHWSGRTSRASLHAPCTQRDKESKTKDIYPIN